MAAKAPVNLGAKAGEVWSQVTTTYQLRPDELRLLEDACRTQDLIDRLEQAVADTPLTAEGSMRQPIVNPLIQEIRQQRLALHRLLTGLRLPDAPGGTDSSRSVSARNAAMTRWGHGTKAN